MARLSTSTCCTETYTIDFGTTVNVLSDELEARSAPLLAIRVLLKRQPALGTREHRIPDHRQDLASGLPTYLKTKYAFHAPPSDATSAFREELLRELLELPLDERLEAREVVI
jgi:hypothetical protein